MQKYNLILVRGLPGSGKSTYAMDTSETYGHIHLESDMFFEKDGEYKFDMDQLKEAHEWCLDAAKKYLDNGMSVIVSNTFIRTWELHKYLGIIDDKKVCVVECSGVYGDVHNVPGEALKNMATRFTPTATMIKDTCVAYVRI